MSRSEEVISEAMRPLMLGADHASEMWYSDWTCCLCGTVATLPCGALLGPPGDEGVPGREREPGRCYHSWGSEDTESRRMPLGLARQREHLLREQIRALREALDAA